MPFVRVPWKRVDRSGIAVWLCGTPKMRATMLGNGGAMTAEGGLLSLLPEAEVEVFVQASRPCSSSMMKIAGIFVGHLRVADGVQLAEEGITLGMLSGMEAEQIFELAAPYIVDDSVGV